MARPTTLHWYLAPRCELLDENTGRTVVCPGTGDPAQPLFTPLIYAVHCYRGDPNNDCLVGLRRPFFGMPTDWVPKSVAQAQAHFTTVMGTAPTADEVF